MLIDPIPPYSPRRRLKIKPTSATPVPSGVRVVGVTLLDSTGAVWTFDAPVTALTDAAIPQLRVLTPLGWRSAVTCAQWDDNAVACDYADDPLAAGQTWEIVEPPVGLDFGGLTLALPQSGVTVVEGLARKNVVKAKRKKRAA